MAKERCARVTCISFFVIETSSSLCNSILRSASADKDASDDSIAIPIVDEGAITIGFANRACAAIGKRTIACTSGHKLSGALDAFPEIKVEGVRALDAGASTGGFTDVLLRRGAREVVAVDVGYGQLAWELRQDPRVLVLDRTNIRHLTGDVVGEPTGLVVADLSFISLTLVLPALSAVSKSDADFLLMVKPQFEVGREKLGAGGVVRDPALRKSAVMDVATSAYDVGLGTKGVVM